MGYIFTEYANPNTEAPIWSQSEGGVRKVGIFVLIRHPTKLQRGVKYILNLKICWTLY